MSEVPDHMSTQDYLDYLYDVWLSLECDAALFPSQQLRKDANGAYNDYVRFRDSV